LPAPSIEVRLLFETAKPFHLGNVPTTFPYEQDLCDVLSRHLDTLLFRPGQTARACALSEQAVGAVIPDFIYVRTDELPAGRVSHNLTRIEAAIVALVLQRNGLDILTLAETLFSTPSRLEPRLSVLRKKGVLVLEASGSYRTADPFDVERRHIVAVEAKLTRWQDALEQAVSYLTFANESYIALPHDLLTRRPGIAEEASARGIGVIGVRPDSAEHISQAVRRTLQSPEWIWLLSRTFGLPQCSREVLV
jgi:hypothetical protein